MSELLKIPGVGKSIEKDLIRLGYLTVESLKSADPEAMFERDCAERGPQDLCLLYVYRCAVYYARTEKPEPELLKWWNWKGRKL